MNTIPLLEQLLADAHPLMAEALHMAAVPNWYDAGLLQAIRQRDDHAKNEQLAQRMTRYSFIVPLPAAESGLPLYTTRPEERDFLQRHWIAQDPDAYRQAHQHALAYWLAHPDPNPFAQAQNVLYHQLFVNQQAAIDEMIQLFRMYRHDRQLTAIERLLDTAVATRPYLLALGSALGGAFDELDDLITHLNALLAQLRGRWDVSEQALAALRQQENLSPRLRPYVARAYGNALANTGQFVEAIAQYETALTLFDRYAGAARGDDNVAAEKAYTMIALGDAYVGLAVAARGFDDKTAASTGWHYRLTNLFYFFLSLPLALYLSTQLGRHVWHPHFWSAWRDLDWLIARLYAKGARCYQAADPILEAHGAPSEGVAADERLANLYLEMGDVARAQKAFTRLLNQEEAPLSDYRQAVVRVSLAEALLRDEQAATAQAELATAVPILQQYEDLYLLATARALLGMARQVDDPAEALMHLQQALGDFQAQDKIGAATNVSERLRLLAQDTRLDGAQRETAVAAAALPLRRYRARYRHPLTILFQRGLIILLAFTLFLIPVTIFRLETGSAVAPEINFNAAPLLQADNPNFTPNLSQGVSALRLTPAPNPDVFISLGIAIFAAYLLLSTGIGLFIILRTPLRRVQSAGDAKTVQVSDEGVTMGIGDGARTLHWTETTHVLRANIIITRELLKDNALTVLRAADQPPIHIGGATAWYDSVSAQMMARAPAAARRSDFSYRLLYSRMGALYVLTWIALWGFALLGQFAPHLVVQLIPGTPYSLASLYPYLYLGLFAPPFSWFVLRPLQIARHLTPTNKLLPTLALASGLLITILRLATLLRSWLTVPDIYPTLAALLFALAGGWVVWRARKEQDDTAVYTRPMQLGATLVALFVLFVMGSHLWREVSSYHYLTLGNAQRDRALSLTDPDAQTIQVKTAVTAYTRAMSIAETPILGIRSSDGLRLPIGIPQPMHTTWLAALNSRAAMQAQLGQYTVAVHDYTTVLNYTDKPEVLVSRAIAYQGMGTSTAGPMGEMDIERDDYQRAIADFNQAIAAAPDQAHYLLWRGVAYHALNRTDLADADYANALAMGGDGALAPDQQAQAYTGRGWIAYANGDYETAVEFFDAAATAVSMETSDAALPENTAAADALLGLGYAYYSLRQYDEALEAWNAATDYNAQLPQPDPGVYISLGTLYWRVGTLGDDYNARGSNQCSQRSLSTAAKEATAVELEASIRNFEAATAVGRQSDAELAFTYRTMGQVYFLLASCPNYDEAETLLKAVDSYSQAIALTPDNALYWHMRGRLAYAAWQALPAATDIAARELLLQALADQEQALALDPIQQGDYRPQVWYDRTYEPAVNGTLARAEALAAAGQMEEAAAYYALVADYATDVPLLMYQRALAAVQAENWATAAALYHDATLAAAAQEDLDSVKTAAFALRDYVLTQPRLDVLTAYWPLSESARVWETAVAQLERPDRYWRYRAEFGFRFSIELFKQRPGDEASYETIYKQIIADIEGAYRLNPATHQVWRDFFVDVNIGWLYLRRADDYYNDADYDRALADYAEAAARIQPNSDNARNDLADAFFRAGITALHLQNYRSAERWYNEGIALARRYGLDGKMSDAAVALEALLVSRPELASVGGAILERLNQE